MESGKRKRLEAAGWRIGGAVEFLGLDEAETELIEIKVRLAKALQEKRENAGMTQAALAKKIGTSQPRVANMLAARDVSIDHLVKSLLLLGADAAEVARALAGPKTRTT